MTAMKQDHLPVAAAASPLSSATFPRYWQQRALAAWDKNSRWGVIETGHNSGKAYPGVAATISTVLRDARVLIVVPHMHRGQQWLATLKRDFPAAPAGSIQVLTTVEALTLGGSANSCESHNFALVVADDCLAGALAFLDSPLGKQCERFMALMCSLSQDLAVTDAELTENLGGVVFPGGSSLGHTPRAAACLHGSLLTGFRPGVPRRACHIWHS